MDSGELLKVRGHLTLKCLLSNNATCITKHNSKLSKSYILRIEATSFIHPEGHKPKGCTV